MLGLLSSSPEFPAAVSRRGSASGRPMTHPAAPQTYSFRYLPPLSNSWEWPTETPFTFERVPSPATAVSSYVPVRPRRRAMRVMYPAKVRMHLPPPEKSQAKRWLVILCLVVLWQIYTEEPCMDAPLSSAENSVSDYQSFPFQSAEQQAAQLPDFNGPPPGGCEERASPEQIIPSAACLTPTQETDTFEQSAGKSYVVALLVYHRLGNDN